MSFKRQKGLGFPGSSGFPLAPLGAGETPGNDCPEQFTPEVAAPCNALIGEILMSIDDKTSDDGVPPVTPPSQALGYPSSTSDPTVSMALPLRRPLRSFIEEARDAAEHGLKSGVFFTAGGLLLTFEPKDAGLGQGSVTGEADNLATSPHHAAKTEIARATGRPAPKPWR
jgi:hypothetical protein